LNFATLWKSGWFIGALISALFLGMYTSDFNPVRSLELKNYDLAVQSNIHPSSGDIILLNIEPQADTSSERQTTKAITILSNAGARAIALDLLFSKSETSDPEYRQLLQTIQHSGNTLMPIFFKTNDNSITSKTPLPSHIKHATIKQVNWDGTRPTAANNLYYPDKGLAEASAGLGQLSLLADSDGVVRSEPLVIEYFGQLIPSMALVLAAKVQHIPLNDIRINIGIDIELGSANIITDPKIHLYPSFYSDGTATNFPAYSIKDLLNGKLSKKHFNNKIILINHGAGSGLVSTPLGINISRSEFTGHVLESILNKEFVQRPDWAAPLELALLLLIALYLIFLLPKISTKASLLISGLLLSLLLPAGFMLLTSQLLWIQTLTAALLLGCGHIAFALKCYLTVKERKQNITVDPVKTNKMLGLAFQSQGMLEKAFDKFITCPIDNDMLNILYDLALAFERKRQYAEAISLYQHMARHNSDYKDIQTRLISAKSAIETISDNDTTVGLSAALQSGDSIPTLGRYEIISELGKGAMGTVYLGKDPKINRQVAIKTMALSQEFEPDELEEVKNRFFHEAEIAGMLNHPNIVTIFDAGDEHDLAYIAMEYLNGIDLVPYTQKGKLLTLPTVLKITAKVAEALQYAHDNGVIHRDIKPANIMILKNKTVKVTDFGIAHITESSKTKAGVVLGTPSYMSPEQLSGKKLDGRTDLFSLGVMLYEMVCGVRPFRGESISKLMYKIAKEPHASPLKHNPDLPASVVMLIDQLLAKKVDLRIASGSEALERIQQCIKELNSQEGEI